MTKKLQITISVSLVIFILGLMFVPLKIHYSISANAKIIPAKEWILLKAGDGSIMIDLSDYLSGIKRNITAMQIERGDIVQFKLSPTLKSDEFVSEGDTIGYILSTMMNQQLTRQKGDLEIARASLGVDIAGEKKAAVEEAIQQLLMKKEEAKIQQELLERQQALLEQNLISQEEFEIIQSMAKVAEIDVKAAEARLQVMQTGAKREQIVLIEAQIRSLENEIKVLEEKIINHTICSPIGGRIYRFISSDTLCIVGDSSYVAVILVEAKNFLEVSTGQRVDLKLSGFGNKPSGRVVRIEERFRNINGEQIFVVIAELESSGIKLPINCITPCTIRGKPKSPMEYVLRMFTSP